MNTATTYSPGIMRVPSAMGGLTSLFGMGRGEHPRKNHHKNVKDVNIATNTSIKYILRKKS